MRMERWILWLALLLSLPASAQELILGINEGVSYRAATTSVKVRYKDLADDLSRLLKRRVVPEAVDDYPTLEQGLASGRYALAYVHPAHYALRAMIKDGYRLVALTKGSTEYRARFLVRADSPLKSVAELRGRRIGTPDPDSITAVLARATLRDTLKEQAGSVIYQATRYQDAIPFMVEHGFADAGATASESVIRDWTARGGRILASSKPVPIKYVLAARAISDADLERLQTYFIGLDSNPDKARVLNGIGQPGFVGFDAAVLLQIGNWLLQ
ncbi:MAG: phosphate/phosphite/phosphonate ABC transporter substrate-binding protein [Leptothrix sp. (in: b-proteobacteria)]